MNRIDKKFKVLKRNGRKAFIAYITAGDPTLKATAKLVPALEKAGVDILELGIPFSDPLADGPTIQAASQRALKRGANLSGIFKMVKALRRSTDMPIALMTYFNPVFRYGLPRFIGDCAANGVDGVIIPDLPREEAAELIKLGRSKKVATIFLAAPTSTRDRIINIARDSTGFIYYVSLTGVTGARRSLPAGLAAKIRLLKSLARKPVCVGFGVSTPPQARQIAVLADGVIVGSAIVKVIEDNIGNKNLVNNVSGFARRLAKAIHDV
jgi:tryptophan synthase alpha chain